MGDGNVSNYGVNMLTKSSLLRSKLHSIDLRRNKDITKDGYDQIAKDFSVVEIDGVDKSEYDQEAGNYFMEKRMQADF